MPGAVQKNSIFGAVAFYGVIQWYATLSVVVFFVHYATGSVEKQKGPEGPFTPP
jgi:hypothetical protein